MTRKYKPGDVLFYRKDGRPVRVIAGGNGEVPPNAPAPGFEVPPTAPQPVAQPVPTVVPQADPNSRYFTAEEVERFRQQERDKLYPQLSQLQERLSTFEQEREAARQAEEARIREEQAAARRAEEEEMSARQLLERQREEFEQRFAQLEAEREQERALLEREREFNALQAYIQRRVREESEAKTIAPELLDLVDGSSEADIEASITRLREKTNAIVTSMQAAQQQLTPPAPPRGVSPAGYAATGPMEMHSEQREVTPDEIRQMSMADYAKFREQAGIGRQAQGHGIFS